MAGGRKGETGTGAASLKSPAGLQLAMGTKSRESIYGAAVRAAEEQAVRTRKAADRLACEAWNKRMLCFQGPAQPSPAMGDALNAGYLYLEVKCLGCNTHQTVALNWNGTCGARIAHGFKGGLTSAAIWSRCGRRRFRPAIRRQRGGRESDNVKSGMGK
jgi:hypothetical protein